MFSALIRTRAAPMLAKPQFLRMATPMRSFTATTGLSAHGESDDLNLMPRISLEEFYSTVEGFKISDEEALEYMTFASKLAMVSFKDQEEMLSFKGDFQAALAFIQKLDEVDVSIRIALF